MANPLQLTAPRAPNLPLAPNEYSRSSQDQLANTLRLYFNQLDATLQQQLLGFNVCGVFFDTQTRTAAAINTAYPIKLDTVQFAYGVYRDDVEQSRIYVERSGVYNFQFSSQLDHLGGGVHYVNVWFRKNGVDVPFSASRVAIDGPNDEKIAAWNYFMLMDAGDYFELVMATDSVDVVLASFPATAWHPAIPSTILTVNYMFPVAQSRA